MDNDHDNNVPQADSRLTTEQMPIHLEESPPQTAPAARGISARSVAVLCPGPSLSTFEDTDAYDVRIGVNRAAGVVRCDYWVALDVHTAGITVPRGTPVVVNKPNIHKQMCREFQYVTQLPHLSVGSLRLREPRSKTTNWRRFGLTVALVLAAELGAVHIDCFGVDWCGQADFDGFCCVRNRRTESRWERERRLWGQVAAVLAERNVIIRRVSDHRADCEDQLQVSKPHLQS